MMKAVSVEQVDALLPQTQCRECTYDGCKPYAEAILNGDSINRCPPGGVETLNALANLLGQDPAPYLQEVEENTRPPEVAIIDEATCIGCTKCIQACPVDAITGTGKLMHTILEDECTGCRLCIPPCPVDCIDLKALDVPLFDKAISKQRYIARNTRLNLYQKTQDVAPKKDIKAEIAAAVARSKARRES